MVIIKALAWALSLAAVVTWLVALVRWDGSIPCDRSQCISIHAPHAGRDSKSEQIALHIFAKKAWIPDIFAQNAAFQSVLPLADRQKLLYLRCEPLRKFLRAFASHYKIIGSSGR